MVVDRKDENGRDDEDTKLIYFVVLINIWHLSPEYEGMINLRFFSLIIASIYLAPSSKRYTQLSAFSEIGHGLKIQP